MIEKVNVDVIDIVDIGYNDKTKEVTFYFNNGVKEMCIKRCIRSNEFPSKIELVDELVNDAKFGKLSFQEFITRVMLISDVSILESMYDSCVEIHCKLTDFFGDYETLWENLL